MRLPSNLFLKVAPLDSAFIAKAVRAHWGVETSLHWTLDMTFREDESRVRVKNAAKNMVMI